MSDDSQVSINQLDRSLSPPTTLRKRAASIRKWLSNKKSKETEMMDFADVTKIFTGHTYGPSTLGVLKSSGQRCEICFNFCEQISRHRLTHLKDPSKVNEKMIREEIAEFTRLRALQDKHTFDQHRFQEKEEWKHLLNGLTDQQFRTVIGKLEDFGIVFYPISKIHRNWLSGYPKWMDELDRKDKQGNDNSWDNVAQSEGRHSNKESYIGNINLDNESGFILAHLGSTRVGMNKKAEESGLRRMLDFSKHPMLSEIYDFIVRINSNNTRAKRSGTTSHQKAQFTMTPTCKVLLIAQRLSGQFKSIVIPDDLPKDHFVEAIQKFAFKHLEVYERGSVANSLKGVKLFISYVKSLYVETLTEPWLTIFHSAEERIRDLVKISNQRANASDAEARIHRQIPLYHSINEMLQPVYTFCKTKCEHIRRSAFRALPDSEFNALGVFLCVILIYQNAQRPEVSYKLRYGDFLKNVCMSTDREFGAMSIPFPNNKIAYSNLHLTLGTELFREIDTYVCYRNRRKAVKEDDSLFVTANGDQIKNLSCKLKLFSKMHLDREIMFPITFIRNAAANTYAAPFLDIIYESGIKACPARGTMNHSVKTHRKVYVTDGSRFSYEAWLYLRKASKNEKKVQEINENLRELIHEEGEVATAYENSFDIFTDTAPDEHLHKFLETSLRVNRNGCFQYVVSNQPISQLIRLALESTGVVRNYYDLDVRYHLEVTLPRLFDLKSRNIIEKLIISLEIMGYPFVLIETACIKEHETNEISVYTSGIEFSNERDHPVVIAIVEMNSETFHSLIFRKSFGEISCLETGVLSTLNLQRARIKSRSLKDHIAGCGKTRNLITEQEVLKKLRLFDDRLISSCEWVQRNEQEIEDEYVDQLLMSVLEEHETDQEILSTDEDNPDKEIIQTQDDLADIERKSEKENINIRKTLERRNYVDSNVIQEGIRALRNGLQYGRTYELPRLDANLKKIAEKPHRDDNVAIMQFATGYWPLIEVIAPETRLPTLMKFGRGLRAKKKITKNSYITAYYGKLIWAKDEKAMEKNWDIEEKKVHDDYKLSLTGAGVVIYGSVADERPPCNEEAILSGHLANHSATHHNAKIVKIEIDSKFLGSYDIGPYKHVVILKALADIEENQEIFWKYSERRDEMFPCHFICGCLKCLGRCSCPTCRGRTFHGVGIEETRERLYWNHGNLEHSKLYYKKNRTTLSIMKELMSLEHFSQTALTVKETSKIQKNLETGAETDLLKYLRKLRKIPSDQLLISLIGKIRIETILKQLVQNVVMGVKIGEEVIISTSDGEEMLNPTYVYTEHQDVYILTFSSEPHLDLVL